MSDHAKTLWNESFREQIRGQAYNTAPVEALARTASYYLRARYRPQEYGSLHFLEMGCGAGPNLIWLAHNGITVSGIDLSTVALELCRRNLDAAGLKHKLGDLVEGSAADVPFTDGHFDGVVEACVFQHLNKQDRERAFSEVLRVLKPGGAFVGYMLDRGHTVYQQHKAAEDKCDPGTLILEEDGSSYYLTNIGLSHFFSRDELLDLLSGFSVADPCFTTYYLPKEEARKRGYEEYLQTMWTVYAVK